MDPFSYELLSQPLPLGFHPFSSSGGGYEAMDMEQLDNYFRAIGVLPPLPPANAHVQPAPTASSYDDDDGAAAPATYCWIDLPANKPHGLLGLGHAP